MPVMRAITPWKAYSKVLAPRREPRGNRTKSSRAPLVCPPLRGPYTSSAIRRRARLPRFNIPCVDGKCLPYVDIARAWVRTQRSGFERLIEGDEAAAHNQAGPQNQGERCCQFCLRANVSILFFRMAVNLFPENQRVYSDQPQTATSLPKKKDCPTA